MSDELRDLVDEHLETWKREIPELDIEVEGLTARIHKLARYIGRTLGETASAFGLKMSEWDVLGGLRRVGPPYRLSPSDLCRQCSLSSGAMTSRLDRLEEEDLIRRLPDPEDRRGVQVELTDKGRKVWDSALEVQTTKERMFADALTDAEKQELNDLLRKLMLSFQQKAGPPPPKSQMLPQED